MVWLHFTTLNTGVCAHIVFIFFPRTIRVGHGIRGKRQRRYVFISRCVSGREASRPRLTAAEERSGRVTGYRTSCRVGDSGRVGIDVSEGYERKNNENENICRLIEKNSLSVLITHVPRHVPTYKTGLSREVISGQMYTTEAAFRGMGLPSKLLYLFFLLLYVNRMNT